MNWEDPILLDCLKGFDGIFLYPPPDDLPDEVAGYLRHSEHPVIVVDEDLSPLRRALPSNFFPAVVDPEASRSSRCPRPPRALVA